MCSMEYTARCLLVTSEIITLIYITIMDISPTYYVCSFLQERILIIALDAI